MTRPAKDILFAGLILIALSIFAVQVYVAFSRGLTPFELSLLAIFQVLCSVAATWFFSVHYYPRVEHAALVRFLIRFLEGSERVGLHAIEPKLRGGTTPEQALAGIRTGFDFLGIAGSKFVNFLANTKHPAGRFLATNTASTVRLLFLNPDSPFIKQWLPKKEDADRVRKDIRDTLSKLKEQQDMGRVFEVRLYSSAPPMRLQIVDDERAYVCEYTPFWSDGWECPQLCFTAQCERSFVRSLKILYENVWEQADPVDWKTIPE